MIIAVSVIRIKTPKIVVHQSLLGWSKRAFRKSREVSSKLAALYKIGEHAYVTLTDQKMDVALAQYLCRRTLGIPLIAGAAVLSLPANSDDYLRSRPRQALRTNRARANSMGLHVRRVMPSELNQLIHQVKSCHRMASFQHFIQEPEIPYMETWVATTKDDDVIGFARFAVGTTCACIKYFAATPDRELSIVRWKMAADIFQSLASRGIRHVIAGSVLEPSDGLTYYQDRLGFRRCRIIIQNGPSTHLHQNQS